jgi:DNA-binding transcriptional MerR regulator
MNDITLSVENLAEAVNQWCEERGVTPASGQAGERITVRNIRYYRALGLLDAPGRGAGAGFGEKHRLQLVAIRLLQARGLPLTRIQELLAGRDLAELERIERQGLEELAEANPQMFRPSASEHWLMTPLDNDFLLVSRSGRAIAPELRDRLLQVLKPKPSNPSHCRGVKRRTT